MWRLVAIPISLLAVAAIACNGGDPSPPAASPEATSPSAMEPSPTPTAVSSPTPLPADPDTIQMIGDVAAALEAFLQDQDLATRFFTQYGVASTFLPSEPQRAFEGLTTGFEVLAEVCGSDNTSASDRAVLQTELIPPYNQLMEALYPDDWPSRLDAIREEFLAGPLAEGCI